MPDMRHHSRYNQRAMDRAILNRVLQFSDSTPPAFDPCALSDDDLRTEYGRIKERGADLSVKETLTPEETTELIELASRVDAVSGELSARVTAAQATQASKDKFATLPDLEPITAPVEPEPTPAPAAVTAAVPAVPSVATLEPTTPQAPVTPEHPGEFSIALTADGAGALGVRYGEQATVRDVARAVVKSFQTYGSAVGGGQSAKRAIAQFTRNRPEEFELRMEEGHDYSTVQKLIGEKRLEGGSLLKSWSNQVNKMASEGAGNALTAAAGWCAPSENLYDLCSLWSMDGILDLPTATARRGGFNYVSNQPTFAELDASTSFTILTEAEVIANTAKACAAIPCPTFTDTRLDVAVTCITGSFLQSAGYPEQVETWVDGTLTNHAHKLNENIIGRIVTKAGAATVIPAQGGAPTGTSGLATDSSVTASVLSAVDLAATDMRYRERMTFNHTFEVILPMWVLTQMRADIVRKNGWSMENAALADAQIVSWFTVRNIRPQFVYDWQDAFSGLATGPGGAAALTALPTTVQFLVYPAGAVVMARQDVVTLSNVYDATNLAQNLYTRLFTEEGFNLLYPCGSIRLYTAQACPSGATAAQAYSACVAGA